MRKRIISHSENWTACASWIPDFGRNKKAVEGIDKHKQAEEILLNGGFSNDEHVQFYVDFVTERINNYSMYGIETVVDASLIHSTMTTGKIDFWGLSKNHKSLDIIDLKTGFVDVSPFENMPMMAYAYCLLTKLHNDKVIDFPDLGITLNMTIVQPTSYRSKVKTWTIPATEIRGYINKARSAVDESLKDKPLRTAGKQCLRCAEKLTCGTFDYTIKTCGELLSSFTEDIEDYSISQRIKFLTDLKKMCEGIIISETEKAINKLSRGEVLQGLCLNEKKSLSWKDDDKTKNFLKDNSLYANKKPLTVLQAVKKGNIPQELIDQHTVETVKYNLKEI